MGDWQEAVLTVGSLKLIGTYWFQLLPGEEAAVVFGPEGERVLIRLEDYDADGVPDAKITLENEKDLVMHLLRMKKINQWGTVRPAQLGALGGKQVLASLIASPFSGSLLINLALYVGAAQPEQPETKKVEAGGQ